MKVVSLSRLEERFAICRLDADSPVPRWALAASFISVTRTPDELSIVCPERSVPASEKASRGWGCFKVEGPIDLDEAGILAAVAQPIAAAGISLFAISSFDTDYVLVREVNLARATAALREAGHRVLEI